MRTSFRWGWLLSAVGLGITACSFHDSKVSATQLDATSGYAWINANILMPECLNCHSGTAAADNIDLSSYSKIMASGVVKPGDPTSSSLYTALEQGMMPKGGTKMSEASVAMVYQWIEAGAPEVGPVNAPPPPPPPVEPTPSPTYAYIGKYIFSEHCMPCHSGAKPKGDLDLTSYDNVMASGDVQAGDTADSFLLSEVQSGKMPPGPQKLTTAQVQAISDWIQAGSLNN